MALPLILSALHIFPSSRKTGQWDLEQGQTASRATHESCQTVNDLAHDTHERGQNPALQIRLSRPFIRSSTVETTTSTIAWITRARSFVFPWEDQATNIDKIIPTYRWTPIISGILIPFSILLEIPGLTEHWYIRTDSNGAIIETRSNTMILDAGLGISMACGVIANICLVLRFLEKRVHLSTLMAIIFLTVHDLININAVTIFGIEHRFDDGFTYGQAFWMTVCSTIVSTTTLFGLVFDYFRTHDFAQSGSGLTRKQRSLVIIVIILLTYIALGALANKLIQGLTFIDALYFSIVTIETIGFGDITPKTTGARVFTCIYMVFGIVNIGVAIGMTRETIMEGLEVGYRKRVHQMRKRRQEARRFRHWEARWRKAVEWRLKEKELPVWVDDDEMPLEAIHFVGLGGAQDEAGEMHWVKQWFKNALGMTRTLEQQGQVRGAPRGKHLNIDALSSQELEAAALEAGVPLEMFLSGEEAPRHDAYPGQDGLGTGRSERGAGMHIGHAHLFGIGQGWHRTASNNGWPSHPQTPTHAQIGRMAAMLTKVAVAGTGTHIHMLGHPFVDELDSKKSAQAEVVGQRERGPIPRRRSTINFGENHQGETSGWTTADGGATPLHVEEDEQHHEKPVAGVRMHAPAPRWARELAEGVISKSSSRLSYETIKRDMEAGERKAYYAKLAVAWTLFVLFWTVGSAIFTLTEGWSYGVAMYFCFISFTTCGYGDYSPSTPAGRSVFVLWALLGAGAMTILISVLQEVGSTRYKRALHPSMFDHAVKKYRDNENKEASDLTLTRRRSSRRGSFGTSSPLSPVDVEEAREMAQRELEALPAEVVRQARIFQEHVHYLLKRDKHASGEKDVAEKRRVRVPQDLMELLDTIADLEGMGRKGKREVLQDDDSRKTLFMLSIERSLRAMINTAERSMAAIAERDTLAALQKRQQSEEENPHIVVIEDIVAKEDIIVKE